MLGNLIAKATSAGRRVVLSGEFPRYTLVSALALAIDWGLLVCLTETFGLPYLVSAAVGFCAGLALAYVQSVTFVFRNRRLANPRWEFAVFCLIGILGLALTQVLLHAVVAYGGMSYALAKGPVAVVVFAVNFGLRRLILFSGAGPLRSGRGMRAAGGLPAARTRISGKALRPTVGRAAPPAGMAVRP